MPGGTPTLASPAIAGVPTVVHPQASGDRGLSASAAAHDQPAIGSDPGEADVERP